MGRLFTAASSHRIQIGSAGLAGFNLTYGTVAACVQHTTVSGLQTYFCTNAAASNCFDFVANGTALEFFNANASDPNVTAAVGLVAGEPILVAITKATGNSTPTMHYYRFSTNTWVHTAANAARVDGSTVTSVTIGAFQDSTASEHLNGEMFAVAAWPTYAMSSAEIERLAPGDWGRWAPPFWYQFDTSRDNGDTGRSLGRYPTIQTARTGATRGTAKPPAGFRMSPVSHRR